MEKNKCENFEKLLNILGTIERERAFVFCSVKNNVLKKNFNDEKLRI